MTLTGDCRRSSVEGGEMGVRGRPALGAGRETSFTSLRRGGTAGTRGHRSLLRLRGSRHHQSTAVSGDYGEAARKRCEVWAARARADAAVRPGATGLH